MRNIFYSCLCLALLASCKKELAVSDIFGEMEIAGKDIPADGQTEVQVSISLSRHASSDRRNVVFTTSAGVFTSTGTAKAVAKAEYEQGILVAKLKLRVSTTPAEIEVTATPEFDTRAQDFKVSKKFTTLPSVPTSIKLSTSTFGIASNFTSEAFLTASLRNSAGKFASKGHKFLFEDELDGGAKANGRYRKTDTQTADSSKVTTYYATPIYPLGTNIKIRCTLLDAQGNKTSLKDSIIITTNL